MSFSCHPDCLRAINTQEDHDASESAAMVAVNLISSARVILKLDSEYTEYSPQYLVENACPKKEDGQGEMDQKRCELTVKDALKFALKEGIPKAEYWAHLGCVFDPPPFSCHILRVSLKGEVIEANNLKEAYKLLRQQPVGARLHVFSPELDRVGDGIYKGPSCDGTSYDGLRDVIICGVENTEGGPVASVKICYKKKTAFIKVSLSKRFLQVPLKDDESQVMEPSGLLVDYCVPRLSIE